MWVFPPFRCLCLWLVRVTDRRTTAVHVPERVRARLYFKETELTSDKQTNFTKLYPQPIVLCDMHLVCQSSPDRPQTSGMVTTLPTVSFQSRLSHSSVSSSKKLFFSPMRWASEMIFLIQVFPVKTSPGHRVPKRSSDKTKWLPTKIFGASEKKKTELLHTQKNRFLFSRNVLNNNSNVIYPLFTSIFRSRTFF